MAQATITDADGMPLPGANILGKGTTKALQSDFDGNFSIEVADENAILVVSYIGFADREVSIGGETHIKVQLEDSAEGLDEVVVVGYGSVTKRALTTAVTNIKPEELTKGTASPHVGHIGKAPGLSVVSTNGSDPNAGVAFSSGKFNSINTSYGPLMVIDGMPGGSLNNVNRYDI